MKTVRSVACLFLLFACWLSPVSAAEKPNVLFLAVDDMNDWIGCLGQTPRAITPNLDKLAARGVNFTNAHTAGVYCAPSRAANRARIHDKLRRLEAIDDAIHGYLACVSYADAMMGRVLDALAGSPYADNTIVVFWSDHGYHHGEKGQWGKHTLWERTSNVPFIWAGPGIAKGGRTDATVSLIDIYPTLGELCGLPEPRQKLEGKSLASALADPNTAEDRDVFLPYMAPGEYAVIHRQWRYIRYGDDGEELYDLRHDPHEWTNLASRPEYAGVIDRMRQSAPRTFAPPATKLNARRDLVIEGETFRWEQGQGQLHAGAEVSALHAAGCEPRKTGQEQVVARQGRGWSGPPEEVAEGCNESSS